MDKESIIANNLEKNGFKRIIAGNKNFDAFVRAAYKMCYEKSVNGILVLGKVGVGKTTACNALIASIKDWKPFGKFFCGVSKATDLSDIENLFVDDMGIEKPKSEYGNIFDPVAQYILRREIYNRNNPANPHLFLGTTNLSAQELAERYSDRVVDRLRDSATVIFEGVSRRGLVQKQKEKKYEIKTNLF